MYQNLIIYKCSKVKDKNGNYGNRLGSGGQISLPIFNFSKLKRSEGIKRSKYKASSKSFGSIFGLGK